MGFTTIFRAVVLGGQYGTLSQICRILTAFYMAYLAKNCQIFSPAVKSLLWCISLVFLSITAYAGIINVCDYVAGIFQ